MGLTATGLNALVTRAGEGFTWPESGTSKPSSHVLRALRVDLLTRQNRVCFDCGERIDGRGEFCHIVSRGPAGNRGVSKGWTPGNIAMGHTECNAKQKANGPIVDVADMVRADVIVTDWLPMPVLRRMGESMPRG